MINQDFIIKKLFLYILLQSKTRKLPYAFNSDAFFFTIRNDGKLKNKFN